MAHPSLRGLSYVPSSVFALGLPLLSTLILPLLLGVAVKAVAPRWAARLVPIGGKLSTVARRGGDRGRPSAPTFTS